MRSQAPHRGQNSYQIINLGLFVSMSVRVNSFLRSLKVEIREVMEVATSDMIDIVTVL